MLQRPIVLGRKSQSGGITERSRNKSPGVLLSTDPMTLVGYGAEEGVAPGWRPLLWFWCSVAALGSFGGLILALLGPPAEHTAPDHAADRTQAERTAARPQDDGIASATAASTALQPMASRTAEAAVPPVTSVTEAVTPPPSPQPQAKQASRNRAAQPPATPPSAAAAPGDTARPGAPPHGRTLVVLHPARGDGGAALAARLAARAGIAADQVDVGAAGEVQTTAEIYFYSESDHEFARRLGRELAGMAYKWKLENHAWRSDASKDRAIEVWLPSR